MNLIQEQKQERIKKLLEIVDLTKSGYAGILPNGNIVDRREFPNAIAVQENSLLGCAKPNEV